MCESEIEQLEITLKNGGSDTPHHVKSALVRQKIALAALTAKPVGEVIEMSGGPVMDGAVHLNSNTYREIKGQLNMKRMSVGTKFYATTPVPVKQEGEHRD